MLQPSAHVPGTVVAEVPIDGGRLILALTVLDAAGVDALRAELADAAGRMESGDSARAAAEKCLQDGLRNVRIMRTLLDMDSALRSTTRRDRCKPFNPP